MYNIELYEDKDGICEIERYLQKLRQNNSKEDRINLNKIRLYINLLAEYGFELNEPYIKKIDKEIWELRPIKNRILFASWHGNNFILLSYFIKQTQKTPKKEIVKAKLLLEDYKRRKKQDE